MRLWAWGQSNPGRKRERNEDSYLVDPEHRRHGGRRWDGRTSGRRDGEPDGGRAVSDASSRDARGNFDKALLGQIRTRARARPRR